TGTLDDLRPSVDPQDITSQFFYDEEGRRTRVIDGEGYLTETSYDAAGNIYQVIRHDTDGTIHTTSYQYDGANRLTQQTDYEGTVQTNQYDTVGNLLSTTHAAATSDARTVQQRYDALGRVIAQLSGQGSALIGPGMTQAQIDAVWNQYAVHYAYDLLGRKISA